MNFQNERLASILLIGSNISQHCLTLVPEEDSQLLKVAVTLLSNLIFYILGAKELQEIPDSLFSVERSLQETQLSMQDTSASHPTIILWTGAFSELFPETFLSVSLLSQVCAHVFIQVLVTVLLLQGERRWSHHPPSPSW